MVKFKDGQAITIKVKQKTTRNVRDCTIGKTYNGRFNVQGSTDLEGSTCLRDTVSFADDVGDIVGLHAHQLSGLVIKEA